MITFNDLILRVRFVRDRLNELNVTGPKNGEILYSADHECETIIRDLEESLAEVLKRQGEVIQNEG